VSAREITMALRGKWHGSYGTVRCPAHEDTRPSLKLCDGDQGRLLVHCYKGCAAEHILCDLRRDGLLDDTEREAPHDEARSRRIREAAELDRQKKEALALSIWRESQPAPGTLVETYLRSRGITVPIPPSLRYHPGLKHSTTGLMLPAMVAAVQAPDRQIRGIHRTFLKVDGTGKAPISEPRLSLGTLTGGAVRLAAADPDKPLLVAEGIETALSAMQASGLPAWAALSTSGLKSLELPQEIATVTICADNDENGAGIGAAQAAAQRWTSEGRTVRVAIPEHTGTDFNDVLRGAAAASIKEAKHVTAA
jgi:putative DNA primase/helicase